MKSHSAIRIEFTRVKFTMCENGFEINTNLVKGSLCESFAHLRYKWLNSVRPSESRPAGRARGPVRHRHRLKLNRHTHGHVASVPIDSQHVTTTHTPTARSFRSARLTAEHCADPSQVSPDLAAAQPARPAACRTLLGRAQGPCPLL